MSYKKFLTGAAIFAVVLIIFESVCMYIIDPLFYYRKQKFYQPQYIATERYQMPGLLKTMDYNTVITATSMGRNFQESYVDEILGGKSFNASLPASTAHEQSMVAQTAFRDKPNLKRVIWELNYFSFSGDPNLVAGPPSDFPTYMYDSSRINDIRYLFSSYSIQILNNNLDNNKKGLTWNRDVYSLYKFGQVAPVETIDHIKSLLNNVVPQDLKDVDYASTQMKSFNANVISVIKAHPNTKFTLFWAPYNIYNNVITYKTNKEFLTQRLKFKKEVFDEVKKYSNVELYDFQDQKQITFNYSDYQGDTVHYYNYINKWIIDYFANNKPIETDQEYEKHLQNFKNQIINFNIRQLTSNTIIKDQYINKQ